MVSMEKGFVEGLQVIPVLVIVKPGFLEYYVK